MDAYASLVDGRTDVLSFVLGVLDDDEDDKRIDIGILGALYISSELCIRFAHTLTS